MSAARRHSLALLLAAASACSGGAIPPQPLPFNHGLHLALELDGRPLGCVDCHAGAERAEHAGLPAAKDCLRCHVRPQAAEGAEPSALEAEVRRLAAEPGGLRWTQLTRNPGHVYAPHRAHVGIAGLDCETCHGDVRAWTAPPTRPEARLRSMSACIACHRQHGAPTECGACHR